VIDQPPPGLKAFGWITRDSYSKFKEAGIVVWTNPRYFDEPNATFGLLVWTEPHVLELSQLYNRKRVGGQEWGGLTEVEFIIITAKDV
jgi:hypothetical protein